MKKIAAVSILCFVVLVHFYTPVHAQSIPNKHDDPLQYTIPFGTTTPPIYSGQPSQLALGYLWLDLAFRRFSGFVIDSFINSLRWGDTLKQLTSLYYQIKDDNPLSFYLWPSVKTTPYPYLSEIGQAKVIFETHAGQEANDTAHTYSLLVADIISDVMVDDTVNYDLDRGSFVNPAVLCRCTIRDEIKGKWLPMCTGYLGTKLKGDTRQIASTHPVPWPTYPVRADSGACLQFEYSLLWGQGDHYIGMKDAIEGELYDSAGGRWIKPGHEYIVFLNFSSVGMHSKDTTYFTLRGGFASIGSGGMYPVINGIVQDPQNDYGLGGSLPVAEWKARLRAKIAQIVHP